MLARVGQASALFFIVLFQPIQFATSRADGEGCIQEDQDIRFGDPLPHGRHIGMFLRDVAAGIAMWFEPLDERGLSRTTRSYDTDKRASTWRLHNS